MNSDATSPIADSKPHIGTYMSQYLELQKIKEADFSKLVARFGKDHSISAYISLLNSGKTHQKIITGLIDTVRDLKEKVEGTTTNTTNNNTLIACYLLSTEGLLVAETIKNLNEGAIEEYLKLKSKSFFIFYFWSSELRIGAIELNIDKDNKINSGNLFLIDGKDNDIVFKNSPLPIKFAKTGTEIIAGYYSNDDGSMIIQMIAPLNTRHSFNDINFCNMLF